MEFTRLDRKPTRPFRPQAIVRNSAIQTVLATRKLDIPVSLRRCGYPLLIEAGPDETGYSEQQVILLAYFLPHEPNLETKGVVTLLHGWEGCSHSNYNLIAIRELTREGYHVFSLNVRDHGPGLHVQPQALNPGVFLGTLLSEVVTAVQVCAELTYPLPFNIVGFSMGGNFALRTAIRHRDTPIPNLHRVVAVNPAINPKWSTTKIDSVLPMRRHFREPWLAQLMAKQQFYPDLYDFTPIAKIPSLIEMTDWLASYTGYFRDADDYFERYSVLGSATRDLSVDTRIITSLDDPIVPVADIYGLAPSNNLKVDIHPHGGHVGYMQAYPFSHRAGELVLDALKAE